MMNGRKYSVIFVLCFTCTLLYGKNLKKYDASQLISQKKVLEDKMYKQGEEQKKYPEQCFYPITDGVADINEFIKRNYKVMFILKEGYDYFDEYGYPAGGGWMMTAGDENGNYPNGVSLTWRRILQIAYGIFNNKDTFSQIPKVPSKFNGTDEYGRIIKSIIYINTNKMPAYKTSNDYDVQQSFYFWKNIIKEQIKLYNPDIVIFCGTYKYYKNSFSELFESKAPSDSEMKTYGTGNIVKGAFKDSNNRLFITAVHPGNGYLKGGDESYFTDIMQAVKDYKKNKL